MNGKISYLGKALREKKISCTELTTQYLNETEKANKTLNAYIKLTPETALKTAHSVDEKLARGEALPPLAGIPMSLKDNISTRGIETTCASRMLEGYKPIYDAFVWEALQKNDAVLLGKTNMDEFAMGSSCESSYFGATLNPLNTKHVSGGSSGGSACAVAGNISVYSMGSDTGGSIRQPASFCGAVGLSPTYGAVSRYGLIAYASSFDRIGPICTSVLDTALVYDAISVYDKRDATQRKREFKSVIPTLKDSIRGKKIGIIPQLLDGIDEDVYNVFNETVNAFKVLGCEIIEQSIPMMKYALPVYYILACAEASSNLGRYDGIRYGYKTDSYKNIHEMVCKTRSEGFGKEVKRRIILGTYVLSSGYYDAYYKKAQSLRRKITSDFDKAFSRCDMMLTPTSPTAAFKLGKAQLDPVATYLTDLCTVPANIAGLPAISFPCGKSKDGLPVGMQLIGRRFSEAELLNASWQFENYSEISIGSQWGVKL